MSGQQLSSIILDIRGLTADTRHKNTVFLNRVIEMMGLQSKTEASKEFFNCTQKRVVVSLKERGRIGQKIESPKIELLKPDI